MSTVPRVSIGMPVYNSERYIASSLASVCKQNVDSMEIVISDNASIDGTEEICRDFAARDERISYVRHDHNSGGVWNVNYLLHNVNGELFKWAFYDDLLAPGFMTACLDALDAGGSRTVLAYSRTITIDAAGDQIEERNDADLGLDASAPNQRLHNLLHSLANQTQFGLMRTSAARRTGGFKPYIGSEMYFLTSMILQGPFACVPDQLLQLRRHGEQFGRDRFTEARWYASTGSHQSLLPFTKMNAVLAQTALASPLPVPERAKCLGAVVTGWTIPRRRTIASDLRHLPRTWRERNRITGERPTTDDQTSVGQNSNR